MSGSLLATALVAAAIFGWGGGVAVVGPRAPAYYPLVESDGVGGAIVLWEDERDPYGTSYDAFVQHLLADGSIAPGWPANGTAVSNTLWDEYPTALLRDSLDGQFVSWNMGRIGTGRDVFLHHMGANGQADPSWPPGGVTVATDWCNEGNSHLCTDGSGGVFVAWEEARYSGGPDIRARRVLATGAFAPAWPDTGVLVAHTPGWDGLCNLVEDGAGGAYVVWWGSDRAYVQHLTSNGVIAPGWPEGGLRVCPLQTSQFIVQGVSDGAGGVVVAWDDNRETPAAPDPWALYGDIFAQRLRPDGTRATGWPVDGLPVCVAPGASWYAGLSADGTGGAVIAWSNRQAPWTMGVQRVLGSGAVAPGWPANGRTLGADSTSGTHPKVASDGAGGAYLAWESDDTSRRAWCMHVQGDGTLAPGWTLPAQRLVSALSGESAVNIAPTSDGGAVVVWVDDGSRDESRWGIWAQKLVRDGIVPAQVSLHDVRATAESVQLEWWGAGAARAQLMVERSNDAQAWTRLGVAQASGDEALRYEDRAVTSGARYAYRLVEEGGQLVAAAVWVEVPLAAEFALAGARPNPAPAGDLNVAFSLATRAAGTLELLDVTGRRIAWRELGSLAAGSHVVRMSETAALSPGVYWLRLAQGARVATARVAVIR